MPRPPTGRRVVITGLGCVSPLGATADETWSAAIAGRSGVSANRRFDTTEFSVEFAAQAPDEFEFRRSGCQRGATPRPVHAARPGGRARGDAGRGPRSRRRGERAQRRGDRLGDRRTPDPLQLLHALKTSGPRRVSPFTIPMSICNMASGYVAIQHGLRGPNLCQTAACASGGHSIGESARAIERGDADVMFAGGSEAPITELAVAAFANMKALSTRNESPAAASRPFDTDRDGFVIGEGAAVLVLEDLERARARGANILAHVLGYGMTADAASVAQPTENGEGAQRCMSDAIADAGLNPSDVDYLNAHATSTPQGDPSEVRAIRAVFGEHTQRLPVSATKSMTGHLLGAAGAVEALLCVRALQTGVLPPTINLDKPDPECELDHVANKARETRIGVAISNSFGFGGTNATLVLGRAE